MKIMKKVTVEKECNVCDICRVNEIDGCRRLYLSLGEENGRELHMELCETCFFDWLGMITPGADKVETPAEKAEVKPKMRKKVHRATKEDVEKIREMRAKGYTNKVIAGKLDFDLSTVYYIEKKYNIEKGTLERVNKVEKASSLRQTTVVDNNGCVRSVSFG